METERALLTAGDRERLSEEKGPKQYQAISRIRRRVVENLADDIQLLKQENPELLDEVLAEIEAGVGRS